MPSWPAGVTERPGKDGVTVPCVRGLCPRVCSRFTHQPCALVLNISFDVYVHRRTPKWGTSLVSEVARAFPSLFALSSSPRRSTGRGREGPRQAGAGGDPGQRALETDVDGAAEAEGGLDEEAPGSDGCAHTEWPCGCF